MLVVSLTLMSLALSPPPPPSPPPLPPPRSQVGLLGAAEVRSAALLGTSRDDAPVLGEYELLSRDQLTQAWQRLEEARPDLGLGVGLTVGGAVGVLGGGFMVVLSLLDSFAPTLFAGSGIALVGIALVIVGPILIGNAVRGRRRVDRELDAILGVLKARGAAQAPSGSLPVLVF